MPTEKNHSSDRGESNLTPARVDAPVGDTNKPRTRAPSEVSTPSGHRPTSKRRLIMGAGAVLGLAIAVVFGIPWIELEQSPIRLYRIRRPRNSLCIRWV